MNSNEQSLLNRVSVLLIEDVPADAQWVMRELQKNFQHPLEFSHVSRLSEAEVLLRQQEFAIVLLDLSLPDAQNLEALHAVLKISPHQCVIVMTGQRSERVGLGAIRLGAHDYLVKGETSTGLLNRSIIFALERKRSLSLFDFKAITQSGSVLDFRGLRIHLETQDVEYVENNQTNHLTIAPAEFKILVCLAKHHGEVVSRETILQVLQINSSGIEVSKRAVDRHISSIKRKCTILNDAIRSIYGVGYKFEIS